jgi:hypothetical protein
MARKPPARCEPPPARCELCERTVARVTEHHLTPRSEGGRETVRFCAPCHRQVHALYTNRTLSARLDTVAKLRADPEVARYLAWVRRQPDCHVPVRRSRSRR